MSWSARACVSFCLTASLHRLELGLERRHVAREIDRREPGGELLEGGPHRIDLDQLLLVEDPDAGATERLRLDEAQQLEVAQSLAHGAWLVPSSWAIRVSTRRSPGWSSPLTIRCSRTSLTCSRSTVREITAIAGCSLEPVPRPSAGDHRVCDLADPVDLRS